MRIAQIVASIGLVILIVTKGFAAGLLVVVALAAVYVLGCMLAPVWLYARLRLPEKPEFREAQLDNEGIPEVARVQLIAHREAFVARGFEVRGLVHQVPGALQPGYFGLYYHRPTATRALSRVVLWPGKGPPRVHAADVELEVRSENGTSVELSNIGANAPGLESVPGIARQMPQIRDPSRLFDYFLLLAARHEKNVGLTESLRVPLPDGASMSTAYHEQFERSYAVQQRAGLLQQTITPGIWRPTWKYALLIAAGVLSPGMDFFKRRVRIRGERLQRDLDGDDSVGRAGRGGAALGWAMLGAGFILGALAILMAPTACAVAAMGMVIVWWMTERQGKEPDWRAIAIGGGTAMLLFGVPMALVRAYPPDVASLASMLTAAMVVLEVLPYVLLTLASALVLEGFRAAAT